ncbi:hypothetical protein M1O29_01195 [Dehalococcoidia bacterium]|nr:hypothetical protein [Dehalococcoidia bacterium]
MQANVEGLGLKWHVPSTWKFIAGGSAYFSWFAAEAFVSTDIAASTSVWVYGRDDDFVRDSSSLADRVAEKGKNLKGAYDSLTVEKQKEKYAADKVLYCQGRPVVKLEPDYFEKKYPHSVAYSPPDKIFTPSGVEGLEAVLALVYQNGRVVTLTERYFMVGGMYYEVSGRLDSSIDRGYAASLRDSMNSIDFEPPLAPMVVKASITLDGKTVLKGTIYAQIKGAALVQTAFTKGAAANLIIPGYAASVGSSVDFVLYGPDGCSGYRALKDSTCIVRGTTIWEEGGSRTLKLEF